jgi:hypothetical protein
MDKFNLELLYGLVRAAKTPCDNPIVVKVHFFDVRVNPNSIADIRPLLVEILNSYPEIDQFGNQQNNLSDGLSYIAIGSAVGDQGLALTLMGIGEACGLWKVITPEVLGMSGQDADTAAGMGLVMTDGYRP